MQFEHFIYHQIFEKIKYGLFKYDNTVKVGLENFSWLVLPGLEIFSLFVCPSLKNFSLFVWPGLEPLWYRKNSLLHISLNVHAN